MSTEKHQETASAPPVGSSDLLAAREAVLRELLSEFSDTPDSWRTTCADIRRWLERKWLRARQEFANDKVGRGGE